MTTLPKTLLTVAITGLIGGSVVAYYRDNISPLALTLVLPLGAVAFGLFLIVLALQKEVSAYDREQAMKGPAPKSNTTAPPTKSRIGSPPKTIQPGKDNMKLSRAAA